MAAPHRWATLAKKQSTRHRWGARHVKHHHQEAHMLYYAVVFLVIALIAALFGFGGIAAGAVGIAKVLFIIFIVLAIVSFVFGLARRR
jgi:uncharacterized membrane protein YtjA (UPF0391 family)